MADRAARRGRPTKFSTRPACYYCEGALEACPACVGHSRFKATPEAGHIEVPEFIEVEGGA